MATSHPDFNADTEAMEVAKSFSEIIKGKTILITGVNRNGIGFATAEALASQSPAHIILAGRSLEKLDISIQELTALYARVNYHPLEVDLSSQRSVRAAAAELMSWDDVPQIDIIINSAGVMLGGGRTLSEDGIETHLATNHLGHFLLACLLMPKLIKASSTSPKGSTRIINVSSASPVVSSMRWSDINFDKINEQLPEADQPHYDMLKAWGFENPESMSYVPIEGYNQSKVANVLLGIALNNRLYQRYGILSTAVHPGIIQTELGRTLAPETLASVSQMRDKGLFSYKTLGAGASTSLVAALDPKLTAGQMKEGKENYGAYLIDCQITNIAHPLAVSSSEAERLWEVSENLAKESFAW